MSMKYKLDYLIMDVDGTLTDGKIYMGPSGEVFKAFDVKDGYGINTLLPRNNITPIIITGRLSDIVLQRCGELNISEVHQGASDKAEVLQNIVKDVGKAAYIGDDLNDLPSMKIVKAAGGVVGCPSDAVDEVKSIADFISNNPGGKGAVREFVDWLLIE